MLVDRQQADILDNVLLLQRCHCKRSQLGDLGKNMRSMFDRLIQFIEIGHQLGRNRIFFRLGQFLLFHQFIDVQTVCFFGRNPSCRSMRVCQVPHIFQIRHLVADRCRAEAKVVLSGQGPGSNGLCGGDKITDDRLQDL